MNGPNHSIREPRALFPPGAQTHKPAYTIASQGKNYKSSSSQNISQDCRVCGYVQNQTLWHWKKHLLARNKEALKNTGILQGTLVSLPAACKNA